MIRRRKWTVLALACALAILISDVVQSWGMDRRFVGVWQGLNPVGHDPASISTIMNGGVLSDVSRHDHYGVVYVAYEWWVSGDEFFIRAQTRATGLEFVRKERPNCMNGRLAERRSVPRSFTKFST